MSERPIFLVPYDFSEHARAALFTARDLASRFGADIHLVRVMQTPGYAYGTLAYGGTRDPAPDLGELRAAEEQALAEVIDELSDLPGSHEAHVIEGAFVAPVLCDTASRLGCRLIVMGTHGRTGLSHAFLGSVAERTLREAPCPVLTVNEKVLAPA